MNELFIGKDSRVRAAWLREAGAERINRPIQRLFPIEVLSGLDRNDELARQQELREEKSRPLIPSTPVSISIFSNQPVADKVDSVQPTSPSKKLKKRRESRSENVKPHYNSINSF